MQRLSRKDIRQKFDAASSESNTRFTKAVNALSAAIDDMRYEGIDVELMLLGCASEQAFELNPGNNVKSWRQKTGGILRIGNSQHLVAFITQMQFKSDGENAEWKDVMYVCVSKLDIRLQGAKASLRTETYNLSSDANGLAGLQEFIIEKAGVDRVITNADTRNSLSTPQQINLGLLKDSTVRAPKISFGKKPGAST